MTIPSAHLPMFAKLKPDTQLAVQSEYNRKKKSIAVTYLLWLIGFHYIYLGKIGLFFLYWLTCGGFLIWVIIDLFRIPSAVKSVNEDKSLQIMTQHRVLE